MDSAYGIRYRLEHETRDPMLRWRSFPPSVSVVCNPPVQWLPYVFNNAECTVWVSDGTSLLHLYRQPTRDNAYAVFLKRRPGGQLQLGPLTFISVALSQDATMEMIAINIIGPNPFRWSQLPLYDFHHTLPRSKLDYFQCSAWKQVAIVLFPRSVFHEPA